MQKVVTKYVDDIDGTDADETVSFGIDGATYAIDLSSQNAGNLRKGLQEYVAHARKVSAPRGRRSKFGGLDMKAVRAWAQSHDINVSSRGRIPAAVLDRYRASGN